MNGGSVNSRGLTAKQALFTSNITNWRNRVTFGNGVKSAEFAGYKGSYFTLGSVAHENLKKPQIIREISRRMKKILSSDEVLQELSDIASADWKDFVDVRYGKEGQIIEASLKLGDKIKALELTGKYHKLFTDKVETTQKPDNDTKAFIFNLIADSAADSGKDPYEIELELQTRLAQKENADGSLRRSYDPNCDPNHAPEYWPSGNLLSKPEKIEGIQ